MQRIHGDCHQSNILWRGQQASLIDFDDMLIGPPVQDLWLLIPGNSQESNRQMNVMLDGYESILDFDYESLALIEPLRTLRYIHFSTWIARRYDDLAFQKAFPSFANNDYWYQALQDLYEQIALIEKSLSCGYS
jgi:Ser/Thr protein kinase RdoA (MazF antagonist)